MQSWQCWKHFHRQKIAALTFMTPRISLTNARQCVLALATYRLSTVSLGCFSWLRLMPSLMTWCNRASSIWKTNLCWPKHYDITNISAGIKLRCCKACLNFYPNYFMFISYQIKLYPKNTLSLVYIALLLLFNFKYIQWLCTWYALHG